MKNGTQKSSAPRTIKDVWAWLAALKEQYAAQSASISFLSCLGFMSALIIQEEVNLSFFLGQFLFVGGGLFHLLQGHKAIQARLYQ